MTARRGRRSFGPGLGRPRALYSCLCSCTTMVVALAEKPFCLRCHGISPIKKLPSRESCQSPGCPRVNAVLLRRNGPVDFESTGPRRSLRRVNPVTSFVCALCPAPPVARTRRFNCLAEATPRHRLSRRRRWGPGSAWSYSKHSHPSAAFESPADTSRHRTPLRQPHSLRG